MKIAPLTQLKINSTATITTLSKETLANKDLAQRLSEMGIVGGNEIFLANRYSDALVVRIAGGTPLGLNNNIAQSIKVLADDKFIKSDKKAKSFIEIIKSFFKK